MKQTNTYKYCSVVFACSLSSLVQKIPHKMTTLQSSESVLFFSIANFSFDLSLII